MGFERQPITGDQLRLFEGLAPVRSDAGGQGGTRAAVYEESQASTALDQTQALTVKYAACKMRKNRQIR
ncbi:MAG: hypothetical protein GXY44_11330 [Phycisphaerales bacterium]|nr:hypothetical protein [Phycisphaerales bacterium]